MRSIPPRGSGWVVVSERSTDIRAKPTRYRAVVLTSSQVLNRHGLNCLPYLKKERGGPNIRSASYLENCFCLNYLAAAAFERAVRRDLYRAAAFLCNAPFCTALSMVEIVIGKSS